jgi:hypothetical protein
MPAPEPVANSPSATYSSIGQRSRSSTGMPASTASSMIVRRVIPGSAARVVGVTRTPSSTANRFAAEHSATAPAPSSMIASLMPAAVAWRFASTASM